MTMLAPTSLVSPTLSLWSLACLLAAGLLIVALPTLSITRVVADETKPAKSSIAIGRSDSKTTKTSATDSKSSTQGKTSPTAEAAKNAYEATVESFIAGMADIEAVYRWSCRWMEAERAERGVAAVESHLDRMQCHYHKIKALNEVGQRGGEATSLAAVQYYIAEAKEMVEAAKKALPDSDGKPSDKNPLEDTSTEKAERKK